jgi:hypothetical protein
MGKNKHGNEHELAPEKEKSNIEKIVKSIQKLKTADLSFMDSFQASSFKVHLCELYAMVAPYYEEMPKDESKKGSEETCAINGHTGEWQELTKTISGPVKGFDEGTYVISRRKCWRRTCARCGAVEETEKMPKEVIRQNLIKDAEELEARALRLREEATASM